MEPPEYRPRPGDELVEPLFAALETEQGPETAQGERCVEAASDREGVDYPVPSRSRRRWLWITGVGVGLLLVLATFWESAQGLFRLP